MQVYRDTVAGYKSDGYVARASIPNVSGTFKPVEQWLGDKDVGLEYTRIAYTAYYNSSVSSVTLKGWVVEKDTG